MSKAELLKAVEAVDDPQTLARVEWALNPPSLPVFNPDTIDQELEEAEQELEKYGASTLEEVRKKLLGDR